MRKSTFIRRLFLLGLSLLLMIPALLLPYAAWQVLEAFPGTVREGESFDCAVVFGAAVHSVSDPGPGILRRVRTGVRLYQDGLIQRFILTGGRGTKFQQSEAEVMRSVALAEGIPESAIQMEEKSSSTEENLRNIKPMLHNCRSIVGISDPYHLARIELLASYEGIHLSLMPTDEKISQPFLLESIFRETLGYAYYIVEQK